MSEITLTRNQFTALAVMVKAAATCHGEDVQGVLLKLAGDMFANDLELLTLAGQVETAAALHAKRS